MELKGVVLGFSRVMKVRLMSKPIVICSSLISKIPVKLTPPRPPYPLP